MVDEGRDPLDPMNQVGNESRNEAYPARSSDQSRDDHSASTRNRASGSGDSSTGAVLPAVFRPLDIPTPPMLEEAIGYSGQARFVAFYWGSGDEVYLADGHISATADGEPYLLFVRHRAIWPGLIGYDFGSSDSPARPYLILDRRLRILCVAPARAADRFLEQQWPAPSPDELAMIERLTSEDWSRLSAELTARMNDLMRQQSAEEAALPHVHRVARWVAKVASRRLRHEELQAWLDALPDDGRAAALTRQRIETMLQKSARERQERDHGEDQPPDLQPIT